MAAATTGADDPPTPPPPKPALCAICPCELIPPSPPPSEGGGGTDGQPLGGGGASTDGSNTGGEAPGGAKETAFLVDISTSFLTDACRKRIDFINEEREKLRRELGADGYDEFWFDSDVATPEKALNCRLVLKPRDSSDPQEPICRRHRATPLAMAMRCLALKGKYSRVVVASDFLNDPGYEANTDNECNDNREKLSKALEDVRCSGIDIDPRVPELLKKPQENQCQPNDIEAACGPVTNCTAQPGAGTSSRSVGICLGPPASPAKTKGAAAPVPPQRGGPPPPPKPSWTVTKPDPAAAYTAAIGVGHDWRCSAARVDTRVLLTAKHCLPATDAYDFATGSRLKLDRSLPHPDAAIDLALLRTNKDMGGHILRRRRRTDKSPPHRALRLAGIGSISPRGIPLSVRAVDLQAAGWGCDAARVARTGCSPSHEMVLQATLMRDSCNGDSGAPLMELIGDAKTFCGWRLVGITSRGIPSPRTACGHGGIYSRVDVLDEWITQAIRRLSARKETSR